LRQHELFSCQDFVAMKHHKCRRNIKYHEAVGFLNVEVKQLVLEFKRQFACKQRDEPAEGVDVSADLTPSEVQSDFRVVVLEQQREHTEASLQT